MHCMAALPVAPLLVTLSAPLWAHALFCAPLAGANYSCPARLRTCLLPISGRCVLLNTHYVILRVPLATASRQFDEYCHQHLEVRAGNVNALHHMADYKLCNGQVTQQRRLWP